MRKRFANKVAVVTGGNSGIGLAAARAYLREGAQVAITGRSDTTLKAAQKELGADALVIKADMSRVSEIAGAMALRSGAWSGCFFHSTGKSSPAFSGDW
jgi:NAD(P)-dependent dehydrogenase (short-subunit alcohol dehydrogenase family)